MSTPDPAHIDAVARVVARADIDDLRRAETARDAVRVERLMREAKDSAVAVLASTDPAVHAAMLDALTQHGVLTEEWALRYERSGDPTMDNPSGITTQTSVVKNRAVAEQAVKNKIPGGNVRNRRVEGRLVTPWEVDP